MSFKKAKSDLEKISIPERYFYVAHYRQDIGHVNEYAGLVCICCNQWQEYGHKETCSVTKLLDWMKKQNDKL